MIKLQKLIYPLISCALLFTLGVQASFCESSKIESQFEVLHNDTYSGRIAFTAEVGGKEQVLELDLDARKVRALLVDPNFNYSFGTFSPDASKIAFVSDRDGDNEIYVADWSGDNVRQLTNNSVEDNHPSWSKDSKEIYYYSLGKRKKGVASATNIYSINITGGSPKQFTKFSGRNSTPALSPNGETLIYSTNRFWPGWDVCGVKLENGVEKCLLRGLQSYCRPKWSHSGNFFAYSVGSLDKIQLGLFNFKENTTQALSDRDNKSYDAEWSPDDRYLAFVSDSEEKGKFELYVEDIASGEVLKLMSSPYSVRYPSWSAVKTIELEAKRFKEMDQN